MNKTIIRNFAVWARNKLIADVSYRASLMGVSENGIANALPQSTDNVQFFDIGMTAPYSISGDEIKQRNSLVDVIKRREKESDYRTAYCGVIEEVAYTWFNRLIAVRFMEVNDYLPSHIRVLSSETGKLEPDLVTSPFDADLPFANGEEQEILLLKNDNKLDEVFRILFIKQCNALYPLLPRLFENLSDYTELLLNVSFIDQDGVVYHLIHDIPEEDFNVELGGQVEIIGWLYQYYNAELKDEVINLKNASVAKENIPAATQLFTTDWVVKYIVDNSLGRYWIERASNTRLNEKLEFYAWKGENVSAGEIGACRAESIKFFDPCMGSGHFLVYAFDVLMKIYEEAGYTERDAADSIIENNIYGLDIDKRASQLAYFAVMMQARKYDRRVLEKGLNCHVYGIKESNLFEEESLELFGNTRDKAKKLISELRDMNEIGSIKQLSLSEADLNEIEIKYLEIIDHTYENIIDVIKRKNIEDEFESFIDVARVMIGKYHVVATNPPYLNKYSPLLKKYVTDMYKDYYGDLFSVFMYRNFDFCVSDGYAGFMTPYVWMFIGSYEKLRNYIVRNKSIVSLVQMEYSAFEEATVPICAFVFGNKKKSQQAGKYFRLTDFRGGMKVQERKIREAISRTDISFIFDRLQSEFERIPGMPIAYWAGDNTFKSFDESNVADYYVVRNGISTGDNERYLRLWQEVDNVLNKWKPCNKGGAYRKWYGNNDFFVFWENEGEEIRTSLDDKGRIKARLGGIEYTYKRGIEMSRITSGALGFRYSAGGYVYESSTNDIYEKSDANRLEYALGYFNSKVGCYFLGLMNPTINVMPEDIRKLPFIEESESAVNIDTLVRENIAISKADWDSFENSLEFKKHPLI